MDDARPVGDLVERRALDVLQDDVRRQRRRRLVLNVVVDLGDAEVLQRAGELGLGTQTGPMRLVVERPASQHLQGDWPVEDPVRA
jgi:hypothetical protein